MKNMINTKYKNHEVLKSRSIIWDQSIKNLFQCILIYYLFNVLTILIKTLAHKENQQAIIHLLNILSFAAFIVIIFFLFYFKIKYKMHNYLYDIWILSMALPMFISLPLIVLYGRELKNISNISIWVIIINVSYCLYLTGSYLSVISIKLCSLLLFISLFIINLISRHELSFFTNNNLEITMSLNPLFFNLLTFIILISHYQYFNVLIQKEI